MNDAAAEQQWHALRVTYCRELKVQQILGERGIRTFVPMRRLREEQGGKVVSRRIPAVNNLLFAFADQQTLYEYIRSEGEYSMTRFIWDRTTRRPIVVPDKPMEDFIRICEVAADDALFLSDLDKKLTDGAPVRVAFGPLTGVEGRVVRIRKSRRILVELPGLVSVASTYIPLDYLEPLSGPEQPVRPGSGR